MAQQPRVPFQMCVQSEHTSKHCTSQSAESSIQSGLHTVHCLPVSFNVFINISPLLHRFSHCLVLDDYPQRLSMLLFVFADASPSGCQFSQRSGPWPGSVEPWKVTFSAVYFTSGPSGTESSVPAGTRCCATDATLTSSPPPTPPPPPSSPCFQNHSSFFAMVSQLDVQWTVCHKWVWIVYMHMFTLSHKVEGLSKRLPPSVMPMLFPPPWNDPCLHILQFRVLLQNTEAVHTLVTSLQLQETDLKSFFTTFFIDV